MQLVLNTYGLHLSMRNRCFCIEHNENCRIISPMRVTSILITKAANITSSAILLAVENNIPMVLVDIYGQPQVKITPTYSPGLTLLRKQQLYFSRSPASIALVKQILLQKTEGHLSNLAWWANRKPGFQLAMLNTKVSVLAAVQQLQAISGDDALRGWEGSTARYYWQALAQLITGEGWLMTGRSYRPANDAFNAMLNYMYGMLYNQVETALTCAGLDSQIGLWHRDNYQTPSLAFDAIEPFRPKIDRLLAELVMNGKITENLCEANQENGYLLDKKGKEIIIKAFNLQLEERVKMTGKITAFKNHILQFAYSIKKHIEKNGDEQP